MTIFMGDVDLKKLKSLWELYSSFFRIGILTFGGGYAMLPMIEKEVVDKHKWATIEEIMDYFAISQCTPGVIAVNSATFIGYRTGGILGGIVATIGVVTPSVIIISLVATVLQSFYDNKYVKSAFQGIGVAVCAILVQAILKIGKSGIKDFVTGAIAILAFILSAFFNVPTIAIIIGAGFAGILYKVLKERTDSRKGGRM